MRISYCCMLQILFFGRQCHAFVDIKIRNQHGMFVPPIHTTDRTTTVSTTRMANSDVEEYKNAATKILSNFMSTKGSMGTTTATSEEVTDPLEGIDFDAPKIPSTTTLETLAAALDYELIEKEWFVTGRVNPSYFSKEFEFQDPDVQLKGIEEYARGVRKLFDQDTSRAEIISTVVNTTMSTIETPIITCTWRLSGKVNIGYGLPIKPYIIYTDFTIDPKTSLITMQEDRFSLPPWDILLSAFFPVLIGKLTALPAPRVETRQVKMPTLGGGMGIVSPLPTFRPLDVLARLFEKKSR